MGYVKRVGGEGERRVGGVGGREGGRWKYREVPLCCCAWMGGIATDATLLLVGSWWCCQAGACDAKGELACLLDWTGLD